MADFTKAYAILAKLEGGYQAVASDTGNYVHGQLIGTNRGVAAPTLADWLGRTPTVLEMRSLSADTARQIFRRNYWQPLLGDRIANQSLAELLFDFAANSGVGTAVRRLQRLLNGGGQSVPVDGAMGPRTLAALNAAPAQRLFDQLKASRVSLYTSLASTGGRQEWLRPWLERLDSYVFPVPAPAPPAPAAG